MNLGGEVAWCRQSIDEVQLAGGVHQSLLVVLAMNVEERWSKFLQCRNGRRLVVDEDAIASVGRNLAADDDLGAFGVKAEPLEFGGDIGFEDGFDDGARSLPFESYPSRPSSRRAGPAHRR